MNAHEATYGNRSGSGSRKTPRNGARDGSWNRRYPRYPRTIVVYGGGYGWGGYGWAPWLFYPWLDADLSWDLWHDSGDGNYAAAGVAPQQDAGYNSQSPDEGYSQDPNAPVGPQAASMESDSPAATLLFRDGRAPLRTANYVVSAESVVVSDNGRLQTIPLADIDVAKTNELNAQAGSSLVLPE